ncbi:hypothetical protein [Candidatus Nitrosocosmicus hydrocola]|uniref:hypothetical protein n=1 Tax=Candidatus Nitrosocosmicus hydrocola TaxID=1826872 RepID=UPI0011E5D5DE|nr:hypothetical protein [Candidatus Nitrosocosmicus hydrocola]
MLKNLGIIFSGLLILLLLSNIHYNSSFQVLGQNNTSSTTNNNSETAVSSPSTLTTADTASPSTNITKLTGGVKINSPDKGDLVPLNSNKSLVINGVSKDNASSDCDVTIIVNNVKPYQNVQPTGIQGNNDYSTWQYTLASNYTSINEGNNKITSKIYCAGGAGGGSLGAGTALSPQPSQAYYSVNITASNFTQAQLTNYELMLESASNSTNGNSTLVLNGIQPVAQIQQFNQDTGSGPVCCTTVGGTIPGQTTGTTSPTAAILADDTPEVATDEEEEVEEEEVEEENTEEENNRNDETDEEESNNNDEEDNDNDDNDNDSSRDIMNDVEDTMRESGIDFSFDD